MASNTLLRAVAQGLQRNVLSQSRLPAATRSSIRTVVTRDSGAILERPAQVRFGLIKIAFVVTPFLMTGGMISREFATWLEEHELFVPDDDEDD